MEGLDSRFRMKLGKILKVPCEELFFHVQEEVIKDQM